MIKLIPLIFFVVGCTVQNVPLNGRYLEKPFEIITDKSFETVWSNIIDLFAQKGLSIKVIDKSSGLITSEKTSLLSNYSFEKDNGLLENPDAWVVINRSTYAGTTLPPQVLSGEWNVRIKSIENNKTSININLTNINGSYRSAGGQYAAAMNVEYTGKSTGKFEQIILKLIQ